MTKPKTDDVISQPQPHLLAAADWADYELLDSGNGLKLERFGLYSFVRPEPQAMWAPRLSADAWNADGRFVPGQGRAEDEEEGGGWTLSPDLPEAWQVCYDGLRFLARPTPFRCTQDADSPIWEARLPFFVTYFIGASACSATLAARYHWRGESGRMQWSSARSR